jgi:hypothetical protein
MTDLIRIQRVSKTLYWLTTVLAWALPLGVIAAIVKGAFDPAALIARYPALPDDVVVSPLQGTVVAAIGVIAVFPLIAALLAMARLFQRYHRGEILTDACASDILRIGRALCLLALATVLVPTAQLLTLTWAMPGQRTLSIGVDQATLGFILAGGLLFVIGWVMREAARAAEENRGFV